MFIAPTLAWLRSSTNTLLMDWEIAPPDPLIYNPTKFAERYVYQESPGRVHLPYSILQL